MAPGRLVCPRQLEILLEFAEANKNLVQANSRMRPTDQREADKAWTKLALRLNSIGDGVSKTPARWKRMMKCRTKSKAADVRRGIVGTGFIGNKIIPLTDIEKRIVAIIGKVAIERVSKFILPQPRCIFNAPDQSAAPASPIETGIDLPDIKMELEDQEVVEYVEVESSSIAPSDAPAPSSTPSGAPAPSPAPSPCAMESVRSPPPVERQPMVEVNHRSQKNSRPRRPIKMGIDLPDVEIVLEDHTESVEDQEVVDYVVVDSSSIAPSDAPAPSPTSSDAPAPSPSPSPCAMESIPSPPPAERRQPMMEVNHRSQKNSRPRRHHDENLPSWAYELEERRIATEERLVEEVAGLNNTNKAMLACMQQLVRILEGHLNNS